MSALTDFVVSGKIGKLFLGQSKENVLEVLGEPNSWVGKPPCFGKVSASYKQSDIWHYYEGIVGVRFGAGETISELILFAEHVKMPSALLASWPQMHGIKMIEWRTALEKQGVAFTESEDDLNYWILSGSTCIASCWPYPNGKRTPNSPLKNGEFSEIPG